MSRKSPSQSVFAIVGVLCGLVSGVASAQQPELDALIKEAKAEGSLMFFSAAPEAITKRAADTFSARYGVKTQYLRLVSGVLLQRYAAEAEANNVAADAIIIPAAVGSFTEEAVKKGWIEPVSQIGLPVFKSGEYPGRYSKGATALIQINPWVIAYNTDKVSRSDVPKDWSDLLQPRFTGQLIIPDIGLSDAYVGFWNLLLEKYGESFFNQLRAQNFRQVASGIPAIQGVAAGEGSVTFPAIAASVQEPQSRGAPVTIVTLGHTTGTETHIALTTPARAKHPQAARLFANWILSQEGNMLFNRDSGGISLFDTAALPRQYESSRPVSAARREQIVKLLGFK